MHSPLKNICSAVVLLLWLFACGTKPDRAVKIPANILNEETFTKVLVDFALAESAANLNVKNVPVQRFDTVYAFDPLKENHIRQSKYDSTISFYSHNTKLYKKIYENVLATLSEIQTKRDTLKKDSVSK